MAYGDTFKGGYYHGKPYLRLELTEVEQGLLKLSTTLRRSLKAYLKKEGVPYLENYAKNNAPWTDRTHAAREGLTASVYEKGRKANNQLSNDYTCGVQLYHTAYNDRGQRYGKWLEYGTKHARPYPILEPTILQAGPTVINGMKNILEKYEGSLLGVDDIEADNIKERDTVLGQWE